MILIFCISLSLPIFQKRASARLLTTSIGHHLDEGQNAENGGELAEPVFSYPPLRCDNHFGVRDVRASKVRSYTLLGPSPKIIFRV